ncbi:MULTISPECIES: hypothetical protein [Moorena]|nr:MULTISPECIES: hypothetical protein [Moorena]NEP34256.1 hypothetical protein [Moorena sp. SIO3B2]NEP66731.1 hypothetical protein [Moorena sp. SIO3A5]NEQ12351.1 hypothetical protein [Moorena sp. SIO4E2]NER91828.1 hypothetical protein [Moorena sp. SIO3A2]NES45958.1 hypothetical protein [Moorena sp. SIO2C4]
MRLAVGHATRLTFGHAGRVRICDTRKRARCPFHITPAYSRLSTSQ